MFPLPLFSFRRWLQAALVLLLGAVPLSAATPRQELLRLVPDEVGFCLLVQDLRGKTADLLASPFVEHLLRTDLARGLAASAEFQKVLKFEKHLEKYLGVGWVGLRDDILGDAVVLAYRPGPPGKPDQEQGLFLVRARDAKTLERVVAGLNRFQKEIGELQGLEDREYKGIVYQQRKCRRETNYSCVLGPILLFSAQEAMLLEALERSRTASEESEPAIARQLRELGLERCTVAWWLQPRVFDAAVLSKVPRAASKSDEGNPERNARPIVTWWKAFRGAGVGLELERDLNVKLAVRARVADLPPSARRFLTEAGKPSEVWRAFPEDPLLAVGGRIDLPALAELIGGFISQETRETLRIDLDRSVGAVLGKDFFQEVLPALGPDWGMCLTAPAPGEKGCVPGMVLALRMTRGSEETATDQAILDVLRSWAQFAVLANNFQNKNRPIRLRTIEIDRQKVRYLEGEALGPSLKPAFGLKGAYLLLTSSPELIRRFSLTEAPKPGPVPLLRISFKGWRTWLAERHESLSQVLAEREAIPPAEARRRLDKLRSSLELVDRLELRQQMSENQVTFTLQIQPSRPLRK
jgi:hypothetical protein